MEAAEILKSRIHRALLWRGSWEFCLYDGLQVIVSRPWLSAPIGHLCCTSPTNAAKAALGQCNQSSSLGCWLGIATRNHGIGMATQVMVKLQCQDLLGQWSPCCRGIRQCRANKSQMCIIGAYCQPAACCLMQGPSSWEHE